MFPIKSREMSGKQKMKKWKRGKNDKNNEVDRAQRK